MRWRSLAEPPKHEPIDRGALRSMLTTAHLGQDIVAAKRVDGGFANTSYKVALAKMDSPILVRMYVRDPTAASREASILELVKGRVPVPEVLYVSPEAPEAGTFIVLRWVGGVRLDEELAHGARRGARSAVRATGRVLAALQAFQFPRSGFFGPSLEIATPFSSGVPAVVGVLEQCLFEDVGEERLGVALAQRVWHFVKEREDLLSVVDHHSFLVHGDFGDSNVIIEAGTESPGVAALIDWEYAHSGTPLVDLGSMLRYCAGRPPWFNDELLRGYRESGGILPDNWQEVSRGVDLVKLCAFVRSPNAGDVAVNAVRAIVEATLSEEHR